MTTIVSSHSHHEQGHEQGHELWMCQLKRLHGSIQQLSGTNPCNILEHFFLQALVQDFPTETDEFKTSIKQMIVVAARQPVSMLSPRQAAVSILVQFLRVDFFEKIRLADIRNLAVFQVYCKCGVTIDTYFQRFSSPPGTSAENVWYGEIAHGNAMCNAETTQQLSNVLLSLQFLKRMFVVKQYLANQQTPTTTYTINWIGSMWSAHIKEKSLSVLIWDLFLDIYHYKTAIMSFR